jgi:hypothetical protein
MYCVFSVLVLRENCDVGLNFRTNFSKTIPTAAVPVEIVTILQSSMATGDHQAFPQH